MKQENWEKMTTYHYYGYWLSWIDTTKFILNSEDKEETNMKEKGRAISTLYWPYHTQMYQKDKEELMARN